MTVTAMALLAFASNSLLCRLALSTGAIDAASFTGVRVLSGAATLILVAAVLERPESGAGQGAATSAPTTRPGGNWPSAGALALYAVAFSFAYVTLNTATGALLLFGAVQTSIMLVALRQGERAGPLEWTGILTAVAGLLYLVSPGLAAPPLAGSLLMTLAGLAWGAYTLRGRGAPHPIVANRGNFVRSIPIVLVMLLPAVGFQHAWHASAFGLLLALASGVASGVGYVIWYSALRGLSGIGAATVQLSVPVLAAGGGVLLLGEAITLRLVVAACLILGGIGVAAVARTSPRT